MSNSTTILVPVDFQEASLEALSRARDLGGKLGLEVVLLHVYTVPVVVYPGFGPIMAPSFPEEIATAAKGALEQLADQNGKLRTVLRCGDPATETLQVIDSMQPAMVVMGTHGRRGLAHLLLGSVAEAVIRKSPVPVLTVRARAT